jgi:indolepyruvate decarboxylase
MGRRRAAPQALWFDKHCFEEIAMTTQAPKIGQYLIERLHAAGVEDLFGVPGDYILRFYEQLTQSPIRHVGTTREDTAAFAADGYARCRGIGALAVTYGVGALNVVNPVAGAYAESSPVVVISGAPGVREQREDPLIHHRFGPFEFQRQIFERITCATAVLDDPYTACRQIDRALEALRLHSKPVYIELPRDQVDELGFPVPSDPYFKPMSDAEALREAVEETIALLGKAQSPVLLTGVELHRRRLQDAMMRLVERMRMPVAATLTGKSVISEWHPYYLGVYEGAMGPEAARLAVEEADALLLLGVTLNDVDLGIYSAKLDASRMVRASGDEVFIRRHRYPKVYLQDFVQALCETAPTLDIAPPAHESSSLDDFPRPRQAMSTSRLIARLNALLSEDMMVVCDIGDCLFGAIDLRVHERGAFLASAYYTTMGFGMPAALGAQVAHPERRALVLVGDGAFQMTGTELSSIARLGLPAIVIVFNNRGYSTERLILEGPFNDIASWRFDKLGEVMGPLAGYDAPDEEAFEHAIQQALLQTDRPSIINAHLAPNDSSPAMRRLGEFLGGKV